MTAVARNCGTCRWWGDEESAGFRECLWPRPDLPFWAKLDAGAEYDDWTEAADGRHCKMWEAKP